MTRSELSRRIDALTADRVPFVSATVVRAQRPTSVRPGDSAIVLGDGTIEGFVGGACGESAVRMQALRVLETGEPMLLRIVPGDEDAPAEEGAVTVANPCLSGGALEIFLEPRLPAQQMAIVGDTPVALALADLGQQMGYDVALTAVGDHTLHEASIVVVASHGRHEERALAVAVKGAARYVGLVASPRRGAAVIGVLRDAGLTDEQLRRLHTPAGLDIGARSPEEIAVSIFAEVVATRQRAAEPAPSRQQVLDPVCGMTIAALPTAPQAEHEGVLFHFCCEGCRETFLASPAEHAGTR